MNKSGVTVAKLPTKARNKPKPSPPLEVAVTHAVSLACFPCCCCSERSCDCLDLKGRGGCNDHCYFVLIVPGLLYLASLALVLSSARIMVL